MSSVNDPNNLKGMLGILINDKDLNLDALEQSIINGTDIKPQEQTNVVEEYNREIEDIMSSITTNTRQKYRSQRDEEENDIMDAIKSNANKSNVQKMVLPDINDEDADNDADDNDTDEPLATLDSGYTPNNQIGKSNALPTASFHSIPPKDPYLATLTDEQRKQQHINSILSNMDNKNKDDDVFLQQEDEEDEMVRMLEQIDLLKSNLEAEGVDISRIPDITSSSSPKEAKRILKILQIKNDRSRYCDMFEEGILAVAYGVENMFDGKKEWFGTKIDLVGWPETVKVKLRRMRYDTSSFVSEVMKGYSISHGWRIIFELLPSLFLYSRQRRTNNNDNLTTDKQYQEAMQSLAS